jgi:hypothetical protein
VRALVFVGPGVLEWREAPDPVITGDREAIVRPIAASTCDLGSSSVARCPSRDHMQAVAERAARAYAETLDVTTSIQVYGALSFG